MQKLSGKLIVWEVVHAESGNNIGLAAGNETGAGNY
jgi:hypothetical protein